MFDVIIRGGDVIDGTGAPRRRADVAIADGRIVAIGDVGGDAHRVVDAAGRVVAPGFVDVHTHLDVQGFWDSTLSPSPLHGITTAIGGNCGFSVAPLRPGSADYLMRMLARVEGMPIEALEAGVPWDWDSTAQYFARLEGTQAINTGYMVGHSALRCAVMGDDAAARTATAEEVAQMCDLLREGLAAGGIGFSSTWSQTHSDHRGVPVPSRFADHAELVALAAVCGEFPGTSLEFLPGVASAGLPDASVAAMIDMTAAAKRPVNWNVIFVDARTLDHNLRLLEISDAARAKGGKVVVLTMPVNSPARFSFLTAFALDGLPGWAETMALAPEAKLAALGDPATRDRLLEQSQIPSQLSAVANWGAKVIVETHAPENERYEGRVVRDIAEEEGKRPFDALLDIVCADQLRTSFTNLVPDPTPADWDARLRVWRDDRAVVGASDAGAHLDMTTFFNYSTAMLAATRDAGLLPLEEAVHMLTDVPARLYGLDGRGRLADGYHADVVVFDEATVASEPVTMRYDLPAGAGRLYAEGLGIDHVLVNGVEIVDHGAFTDARPGTLLRSGRDTSTPDLDR